jgi:hypothetical protein
MFVLCVLYSKRLQAKTGQMLTDKVQIELKSVSCGSYVLSGRGLCVGPIPALEESYRL